GSLNRPSATGRAPATSARPPVFTSGKTSDATARTRIKSTVQPVDHGLRDQANPPLGTAKPARILRRVLTDHQSGWYPHGLFHNHVAQPGTAADIGVRQDHRLLDPSVR